MKKNKIMNKIIVLTLFVFYMYLLLRIILFKFGWMDMPLLLQHFRRTLGNPDHLTYQLQSGNNLFRLKQYSLIFRVYRCGMI